ncbi:hypothetical protein L0Y69_01290, partial [bacterium]|nr:hypothetical protein [bacterium]
SQTGVRAEGGGNVKDVATFDERVPDAAVAHSHGNGAGTFETAIGVAAAVLPAAVTGVGAEAIAADGARDVAKILGKSQVEAAKARRPEKTSIKVGVSATGGSAEGGSATSSSQSDADANALPPPQPMPSPMPPPMD